MQNNINPVGVSFYRQVKNTVVDNTANNETGKFHSLLIKAMNESEAQNSGVGGV